MTPVTLCSNRWNRPFGVAQPHAHAATREAAIGAFAQAWRSEGLALRRLGALKAWRFEDLALRRSGGGSDSRLPDASGSGQPVIVKRRCVE